MNRIKKFVFTLSILSSIAANAAAEEFPINSTAINASLETMAAVKINAFNNNLSAKVTAVIEEVLQSRHPQQVQVMEMQPYSLLIFPVVENERVIYDLEKNRS